MLNPIQLITIRRKFGPKGKSYQTIILLSTFSAAIFRVTAFASVHPEIVAFGPGQGRNEFETAGVARLRRKNVNGYAIISNS